MGALGRPVWAAGADGASRAARALTVAVPQFPIRIRTITQQPSAWPNLAADAWRLQPYTSMGNAVLNVVDGVGGAVNAVVGGVGGALGGLKNACFPGGGGDGGPGGAASRGSLHASGIDARSPTADPPPYQPPTPASGSAVIGAGSGGQQMLVASSKGMSMPSGSVPDTEEKVSV